MAQSDDAQVDSDMVRRDAWDWVLRLTSGEASRADLAQLAQWRARSARHADAFAQASGRWRGFGPALQNIVDQQPAETAALRLAPARAAMGRRAFLGGALAASAAGVAYVAVRPPLDLWPSVTELAADYRTATGEQRRIALAADGSLVMNTRTSLNVHADPAGTDRIELIVGEAAVAARTKTIAVTAGNGRVSADAASFNVRCSGANVSVTCLDGVVDVTLHGQTVMLARNQQIAYAAHGFGSIRAVELATVTGWRDGELYFRDEPLSHVIDEVNRYRSGQIFLMNDGLGRRRFTARFKLDRLETVVTQLEATFGARVTRLPGAVIVVS